jgi:hypothetical protein
MHPSADGFKKPGKKIFEQEPLSAIPFGKKLKDEMAE